MSRGLIYKIEEFAVHDGPGIRTIVFFKGCRLRCNWCHNPESWSFEKELLVNDMSCSHCGRCTYTCENRSECVVCGKCVNMCPLRLRSICGIEYSVFELYELLKKNSGYYKKYNGGVTFSGGEPLAQPDFLIETLDLLKDVHTVIETSGYASHDVFREAVRKTDLVMMDVKHTDTRIHKEYTGVGNKDILGNLDLLCASNKDFIIRIPLIPGVNDTYENLDETVRLVKDAKHLIRIELLPYNKAAGAKYHLVGKTYSPKFDVDGQCNIDMDIFKRHGIECIVL